MTNGKCQTPNIKWQMANDKYQMTNDKWQMESVEKGSWPGLQWGGFPKNVTVSAFPSLDLTYPGLKVGCHP
jgi:hypothetical protein